MAYLSLKNIDFPVLDINLIPELTDFIGDAIFVLGGC